MSMQNLLHHSQSQVNKEQVVREAATICPRPCKLTFDLLTLKVGSESRVTRPTSVPILVFLGLSVLDLGGARCTRQTDVRRASSLNASALCGRGHNKKLVFTVKVAVKFGLRQICWPRGLI